MFWTWHAHQHATGLFSLHISRRFGIRFGFAPETCARICSCDQLFKFATFPHTSGWRLYSTLNWWHACEDSVCVHDGAATLPSWSSKATREQQTLHWIDAQFFMISPYHLSSTACVPQMCVWVFGFGSYQRVLQVECHNKRMVPATAMFGVTCLHREI